MNVCFSAVLNSENMNTPANQKAQVCKLCPMFFLKAIRGNLIIRWSYFQSSLFVWFLFRTFSRGSTFQVYTSKWVAKVRVKLNTHDKTYTNPSYPIPTSPLVNRALSCSTKELPWARLCTKTQSTKEQNCDAPPAHHAASVFKLMKRLS